MNHTQIRPSRLHTALIFHISSPKPTPILTAWTCELSNRVKCHFIFRSMESSPLRRCIRTTFTDLLSTCSSPLSCHHCMRPFQKQNEFSRKAQSSLAAVCAATVHICGSWRALQSSAAAATTVPPVCGITANRFLGPELSLAGCELTTHHLCQSDVTDG